jgi:multisubunit Na+/H+ antiporter MnhE subunit
MSGEVASRVWMWALRWLLLAALWLALADSRAKAEWIAAVVVGAIGATFAGAIVRPGNPRTVRGLIALVRALRAKIVLRPFWRLAIDSSLLTAALWRRVVRRERIAGSFRATRHAPPAAARTAAGRSVAEIWGSVMPNRYVVGIDDEEDVILVHELIASDQPLDPLAK